MSRQPNPAFLRRAIELATQNVLEGAGGPFAALIVRDGEVIAEAANSVTTTNDPTAHGEVNAIRKACTQLGTFSLTGCEIYTSCEPCPMCLAAIYWARLEAIYFGSNQQDAAKAGFDDAFLYEEFRKSAGQRNIPSVQLLQSEAWEPFATWITAPIKVNY
ncbi:nucleoside deaminase [Acidicapsa acidisoli]|uniref:nucleoside deaminase n=1 Tax=Acidicapsa acidisoli TaxID=1615681 RepID=UPI0021E0D9C0|nr:nucleoside deaminase [Acidicapsa acidisoli]